MQFKFFRVPAAGCPDTEAELNRFLRGVRVLTVDRQFVPDGRDACWSLCVEYLESPKARAGQAPGRVDYREVLSEADFGVFARLRELRNVLAAEEAVPPYTVCTNEQLAEMAKARPPNLAALRKIDGIGEAKASKWGERLLSVLAAPEAGRGDEAGRKSLPGDR